MNAETLQKAIGKMLVLRSHNPICENVKYLFSDWELDVMSINKGGMVSEFEIKISYSDFKADFKKRKFYFYETNVTDFTPNYFSYVCPEGLIKVDEIQKYAGLYYYDKDEDIIEIKRPKIIHKEKHDRIKIMEKICRINAERRFLGMCRLTYENKQITDRINNSN